MQILEQFSLYSGYKINILKTQTPLFNYSPNEVNWEAKSLNYLSINLTKNPSKLYKKNYEHINVNIRNDIDRWFTYLMTFTDRISAVKMSIPPHLLYLFQSLPVHVPPIQLNK